MSADWLLRSNSYSFVSSVVAITLSSRVVLYPSRLKFSAVNVHVHSEIIYCNKMSFKIFHTHGLV